MTDRQRTELIEHYHSGLMSGDESQSFRQMLAGDTRLQQMLEADALIGSTITRDRAAIPSDHAATRAAVMGTLERLGKESTAGQIARGAGGNWVGLTKIISLVVVAGGVLAGVYAVWPSGSTTERVKMDRPGLEQSIPNVSVAVDSSVPNSERQSEPPSVVAAPVVKDHQATERGTVRTMPSSTAPTTHQHVVTHEHAESPADMQPKSDAKPAQRELRVLNRDSVKLKIDVKR